MKASEGTNSQRVLVVDDEASIRDASARIISRMGCQVLTASRGDEGLKIVEQEKPSILLLDLKMPGMDGMEVLRNVRQMDEHILVIVITGFATLETAIEAMKQGAYDFIPKPFEPDQLRIVVNRALEKIRLTQEAANSESERQRTLADLDTEKSRIHTILQSLPNGVVVTNTDGRVVLMNRAFLNYLSLDATMQTGQTIDHYIPDEGLCRMIVEISQGRIIDFDDIPTYDFLMPGDKYLLARGRPVLGERGECLGAVVNIVDITAMKVLDRLKSEFVAKVSHELRSPLSTIHEQLNAVLGDRIGKESPEDQHLLSRAKEKTQGLISLIGDLLDLSRIESGNISGDPKPVNLIDLLKSIVEFMQDRAKAKQQTLSLEVDASDLQSLTVDPLALESIFGNLITNALNYTQEGGRIQVRVDLAGIHVRVRVVDNGFGIEAAHLEHIFERFYRVKDEKTRFITGTGLGLPIVKGLVDSLGGFIDVESVYGQGSTFTVLLPIGGKDSSR